MLGLPFEGARVAIQGFGNVGSITAKLLHRWAARSSASAIVHGGVYNLDGIDVSWALRYAQGADTAAAGLPGTQPIDASRLLELPCDILIPAALEGQLTA